MNLLPLLADYSAHTSDFTKLGEYGITGVILGAFACLVLVVIAVLVLNTVQKKWEQQGDSQDRKAIAESQLEFVKSVRELSVSLGITDTKVADHERRISRLENEEDNNDECR